jgi:hypothetical protein
MYLAESPSLVFFPLQIANGARIDHELRDGATALMAAAREDQREAVKALLQLGADPGLKSRDSGRSACDVAQEKGLQVEKGFKAEKGLQVERGLHNRFRKALSLILFSPPAPPYRWPYRRAGGLWVADAAQHRPPTPPTQTYLLAPTPNRRSMGC